MTNPSGSSIERGVNCPASFALNQARSTGEAAVKGTENHDGIEASLVAGKESKHLVVREALEDAVEVRVEVAYALDVDAETVRFLGSRLGRNYGPLKPSEIALTVDAVIRRPDATWVWDWKSRKRVTAAKKNWQLKAGAVCVMKHLGLSEVAAALGYLDNDEADATSFDAFDIPVFFADLRSMMTRIKTARVLVAKGKTPEVHEGSWCDYCPAMAYCPAKTRMALSMLGELDSVNQQIAFMTPDQAGRAWLRLKEIQSLSESVEAALKERLSQEFFPLPNGKRLAYVDCKRVVDDKEKMKSRLTELGEDLNSFKKESKFKQVKEVNSKE